MSACTVRDIYNILNTFAPFDTAADFDNVGLLVGRMDRPATRILTALDATPRVVREAAALRAELLVTHHPVLFSPIQRLDEAEPEAALLCEMVRAGLSMIAAHTNLDLAAGGVNDALAARLSLRVTETADFLRLGPLPEVALDALRARVEGALGGPVLRYGPADRRINRFALCSGAGGSEVEHAARLGADVLITGEIRHDQALYAMARGIAVLAAGHRATEICAAELLCKHLQSAADKVQLNIQVFISSVNPFG